jgi:hypothetical protein
MTTFNNLPNIVIIDGYKINLAAGASINQALVYNGTAFVAQDMGGVNSDERANANHVLLATTSPTTIVTYTPSTSGNYEISLYYSIVTATTDVTITLSWTDSVGAQTSNFMPLTSTAVGSYMIATTYINSTNAAITVSATAGTANHVYVSSTITAM